MLIDKLCELLERHSTPDAVSRFLQVLEKESRIRNARVCLQDDGIDRLYCISSSLTRGKSDALTRHDQFTIDISEKEPIWDQGLGKVNSPHGVALKEAGALFRSVIPLFIRPSRTEQERGFLEIASVSPLHENDGDADELLRVCRVLSLALRYWLSSSRERMQLREAELFREAAISLTSSLSRDEVIEQILVRLQELVPYKTCSVQLLKQEQGGEFLEIVGGNGFPNLPEILGIRFPVGGDNPNTRVIRSRKSYFSANITRDFKAFMEGPHRFAEIVSWMGVPMILGNKLIGMLTLDKSEEDFFTEAHVRSTEVFAVQAAVALENARHFEELKELNARLEHVAITDELTGLYNRRGFMTLGSEQLHYFRRHKIDSLLIYLDLDNFKEINDTLGHAEGDRALRNYAQILKESLRKSDLVGRMGGDEFVILTGQSENQSRAAIIERIEKRLARFNASDKAQYLLSASTGACPAIQPSNMKLEEMIQIADKELYQSKRRDANC